MEKTLFDIRKPYPRRMKNPMPISSQKPEPMVAVGKREKTLMPASEASLELVRVKGTWPFDLSPDILIVEERRVIIKRRTFPFYTTTTTIPLNKILMFEVTHSIFFSSIYMKGYVGYNIETAFQWLSHKSAQKVKDVVDGLRLQQNEAIEVLEHDKKGMSYALEKLGHAF